jgi:hypothetical protein
MALSAVAMAIVGGFIFYNTNVLNPYRTTFKVQDARAQYEKKYRQYRSMPLPKITDIKVNIDLYPDERLAAVHGRLSLQNQTSVPVDRVAVTIWPEDVTPIPRPEIEQQLSFEGGATPVFEDPALGFFMYRLATPLPPGGRLALDYSLRYPNRGFVNSEPNGDIVHNGSFLSSYYLPFIGYFQDLELIDDSVRHRHGLGDFPGLPPLDDPVGRTQNPEANDADWPTFEGTISTSPDQIAILPGYLQKEWVQDGRRYFHYKADTPILAGIFSANSGRYAVHRDHWNEVKLEIYYQPGHEFNLDRMQRSIKATLDYCTRAFSPYQFRQVRIIEFPRYGSFAESFPNTIPYSEGIGFITYVPNKPDAVDMPFYITAHEVGHQWWGHQVVSGNTVGQTFVVETLAQYTALMVMKHAYGPESMKKFLRWELDGYLRGRAQEHNIEEPLYKVQALQGYIHYNKGGQAMYALQDYIGEDRVNQALAAMIRDYGFKGPPYPSSLDLISHLRAVTPPEYQYLIEDLFQTITLFENRALSASYTELPDGKYQVKLAVESKKYRADGHGHEQPVPLHDLIDIGVLDANGGFLYLQKQKIDQERSEFTLTVDRLPAQAGIDPLIKLVDRNPDDNVVKVEKQSASGGFR